MVFHTPVSESSQYGSNIVIDIVSLVLLLVLDDALPKFDFRQ
jgi:hypothetical protein